MADIIRYVDILSVGGDGTTPAIVGANAAYASHNACFTAELAVKNVSDRLIIYSAAGNYVNDNVIILGAYTDASGPIIMRAVSGHTVIIDINTAFQYMLNVNTSHFEMYGYVLTNSNVNGYGARYNGNGELIVVGCIVRDIKPTPGINIVSVNPGKIYVINCVFYGNNWSIRVQGNTLALSNFIYNCTFLNSVRGISIDNFRVVEVKNCYLGQHSDTNINIGGAAVTLNLTTTATDDASGSPGLQNILATNCFVNATVGSEDVHHLATSPLIDTGTDLSGDAFYSFSDDYEEVSRPAGAWDISASEYVSPSPPVPSTFIPDYLQYQRYDEFHFFETINTNLPFTGITKSIDIDTPFKLHEIRLHWSNTFISAESIKMYLSSGNDSVNNFVFLSYLMTNSQDIRIQYSEILEFLSTDQIIISLSNISHVNTLGLEFIGWAVRGN